MKKFLSTLFILQLFSCMGVRVESTVKNPLSHPIRRLYVILSLPQQYYASALFFEKSIKHGLNLDSSQILISSQKTDPGGLSLELSQVDHNALASEFRADATLKLTFAGSSNSSSWSGGNYYASTVVYARFKLVSPDDKKIYWISNFSLENPGVDFDEFETKEIVSKLRTQLTQDGIQFKEGAIE